MLRKSALLSGLFLITACTVLRAEYITNGSMTGTPAIGAVPTPWQLSPQLGIYSAPSTVAPGGLVDGGGTLAPDMPASPDGGTFLVLTSDDIFQKNYTAQPTSGLVVGQSYMLTFFYANAGAVFPVPIGVEAGTIHVAIAGQEFETPLLPYLGAAQQTWQQASFEFTVTQPLPTLEIWVETSRFFGAIDGVAIVPEPSTYLLGALALLGLFVVRRKRQIAPDHYSRLPALRNLDHRQMDARWECSGRR